MTLLSKTAILAAQDLQTEDVEVPEWGGAVRVRSFTGRERDAFEAGMIRGEGRDRKVDLNQHARAPSGSHCDCAAGRAQYATQLHHPGRTDLARPCANQRTGVASGFEGGEGGALSSCFIEQS